MTEKIRKEKDLQIQKTKMDNRRVSQIISIQAHNRLSLKFSKLNISGDKGDDIFAEYNKSAGLSKDFDPMKNMKLTKEEKSNL